MNLVDNANVVNREQNNYIKNNENIVKHLDSIDYNIISLLALGYDTRQMSSILKISLTTIQRRTKIIFQSEIVIRENRPNFQMLGIEKGLLHTYLSDGQLRNTAEKISKMNGILSTSVHVGNSDIVSEFVYEDSEDLIKIIEAIKQIQGVEKVVWSAEIFKLATNKENIPKLFNKYNNDNIKMKYKKKSRQKRTKKESKSKYKNFKRLE